MRTLPSGPIQTVEREDGSEALIVYSLGNLVSNQDMSQPEAATREGLLLKLVVEREADGARVS